ncbi:uncharacterized protein Bfra_008817 [Botrytis fragariae]|uniref:Uncharacterized protein n=1 Tax=Botrytis fragariae TaxID=1964551 RepID=A0A8H6APX6_9HELO|nr:uncharacterized protein Bfra_008817 [Botrytis fragariae]KAF5871793.1 hypothetical protein Bfra_008817 [Botrytis fragariae]
MAIRQEKLSVAPNFALRQLLSSLGSVAPSCRCNTGFHSSLRTPFVISILIGLWRDIVTATNFATLIVSVTYVPALVIKPRRTCVS